MPALVTSTRPGRSTKQNSSKPMNFPSSSTPTSSWDHTKTSSLGKRRCGSIGRRSAAPCRRGKVGRRRNVVSHRSDVPGLVAPDLRVEHDLAAVVPPFPTPSTDADTTCTLQTVLDALSAHFTSTFTTPLVTPTAASSSGCSRRSFNVVRETDSGSECPGHMPIRTDFPDILRRNLYWAFTHHMGARGARERWLSFYRCADAHLDTGTRSGWEYRLLFVHSDVRASTARGLVITVRLEGSFENMSWRRPRSRGRGGNRDGEGREAWYGLSLESRGRFVGTLNAMQVVVGQGFRCP